MKWLRLVSCVVVLFAGGACLAGCSPKEPEPVTSGSRPAPTTAKPPELEASADADRTPPGMVSFFKTPACAEGWVAGSDTQGRLILGVTNPQNVGKTVNSPLAPKSAPNHTHNYSGKASLKHRGITAFGGSNNSGAKQGDYKLSGTTEAGSLNLPFIQMLTCEKK